MDYKNYYEILEITPSATHQDIQDAYRKAKNSYSSDSVAMYSLLSKNECDEILDQIEEAFSVIGDPSKRKEYDKIRGLNSTSENQPSIKQAETLSDLLTQTRDTTDYTAQRSETFTYQESETKSHEVSISRVNAKNKFGLDYKQDHQLESEIESITNFTGAALKNVREYKNVTIERMAEMTKISKTYIRNIEDDDYTKLPADVYTLGFVYQYAKCLKLNPDFVATSYLNHIRKLKNP
jgi:DnaJ-class molecular chaperone